MKIFSKFKFEQPKKLAYFNNIKHLFKYKAAFTLAETLITLGVLGVVAALTMPVVISKYNEIVIITELKKAYSELNQAIKLSESFNGDYRTWDYSLESKAFGEKYIFPYLAKSYKYCSWFKPCFGKSYHPKSLSGTELTGYWMYAPRIKYNNTTLALMTSSSEAIDINTHKYVSIIIDVNGDKGESIIGKDVFYLTLFVDVPCYDNNKPEGLHFGTTQPGNRCGTYQMDDSRLSRLGGVYGCSDVKEDPNTGGRSCGLLIQRNGWKLPSNYPVKL